MAVSIAFGLAFATTLTLFVIPVIYSLVDSLFGKLHMTRFDKHISFKEAMTLCEKYENYYKEKNGKDYEKIKKEEKTN